LALTGSSCIRPDSGHACAARQTICRLNSIRNWPAQRLRSKLFFSLSKPENREVFRGSANVQRVRQKPLYQVLSLEEPPAPRPLMSAGLLGFLQFEFFSSRRLEVPSPGR